MDKITKLIEESDEITRKEVLERVVEKKKELEKKDDRYYRETHPVTGTVATQQKGYPWKILVLDEIYLGDEEGYQYRFAYWVVSDDNLKKGSIVIKFGESALLIPGEDLQTLMEKAEEINWEGSGPFPQ